MGFKDEDFNKKYIQFEGLDVDPTGTPYGSSIAMEKALDPNQCIMVAYEMNGQLLLKVKVDIVQLEVFVTQAVSFLLNFKQFITESRESCVVF